MRQILWKCGLGLCVLLGASPSVVAENLYTLRIAALQTGTVNWELDTIKHYKLDTANGFTLEVVNMAGNPASQIAFQSGEVDMIVTDWIWAARQSAEGNPLRLIPYSKSIGALMVPDTSDAQTLSDLNGKKIGIAGGPLDKSWILLQAYAEKVLGMDVVDETEQVFGAPPLIMNAAISGDTDAAINFWHYEAKQKAAGMRTLISISDASTALGLSGDIPLLGYVVTETFANEHPDVVTGMQAASRAAKDQLLVDDQAWDRLRPMMNASDDAEFAALVSGFRAGDPGEAPINAADVNPILALMAVIGGTELVGSATALPDDFFVD